MFNISIRTDSFTDTDGKALDRDFTGKTALQDLLLVLRSVLVSEAKTQLKIGLEEGLDKGFVTIVDNVKGRPVESVKPFGKVEYTAKVLGADILTPLYEAILQRSKVASGTYRRNNFIYYNGTFVGKSLIQLKNFVRYTDIKDGDIVRFVNVVPYASRLERQGVTADRQRIRQGKSKDKNQKRRPSSVRLPNGVYFLSFRSVQRNFKNNANVRFEFINGGAISDLPTIRQLSTGKAMRRDFHPKSGRKGPYTYPCVTVRFNGGTL